MPISKVLPAPSVIRARFVDRLRTLRAAKFPSSTAFARALGLEEVRYLRYERGEVEPPLSLIVQACIVLGVEPNDLFPDLPKLEATMPDRP